MRRSLTTRLMAGRFHSDESLMAQPPSDVSRRVLLVDDHQDSAESLALLLQLKGYEVAVAGDGPGALETAARFHPHIVLLDIGMPGMDGYETARLLRQQPAGETLLLVALTGWGRDHDLQRSREAGFDHHVVKPIDAEALAAWLEQRKAS